jgi:hypothetical protein
VEAGEKRAGTDDRGPALPGPGGKRPVGADDLDVAEIALVEQLEYPLIGCITPAPPWVRDLHTLVDTGGEIALGHIEDEDHRVTRVLPIARQPAQESPRGRRSITPPTVGHGRDHVVAVDDDRLLASPAREISITALRHGGAAICSWR